MGSLSTECVSKESAALQNTVVQATTMQKVYKLFSLTSLELVGSTQFDVFGEFAFFPHFFR